MVDSQRQQAEERALKMKSMLVKTKKELTEAKKLVRKFPFPPLPSPPLTNKPLFTSLPPSPLNPLSLIHCVVQLPKQLSDLNSRDVIISGQKRIISDHHKSSLHQSLSCMHGLFQTVTQLSVMQQCHVTA